MWSGNPSQEEARQSRPFSQDSAKKLLRTENRHIRNASIRLDDAMLAVAHNFLHTLHPSTRRRVISHFFFERSITPYFLTSAWIFTRLEKFSGTISHPLLDMPYSLSIIETRDTTSKASRPRPQCVLTCREIKFWTKFLQTVDYFFHSILNASYP